MVGILLSFWEGQFSGAMLVLGRVRPPQLPNATGAGVPFKGPELARRASTSKQMECSCLERRGRRKVSRFHVTRWQRFFDHEVPKIQNGYIAWDVPPPIGATRKRSFLVVEPYKLALATLSRFVVEVR